MPQQTLRPSGYSGASGYSGISGYSGYSGKGVKPPEPTQYLNSASHIVSEEFIGYSASSSMFENRSVSYNMSDALPLTNIKGSVSNKYNAADFYRK